jgi:FkbM family methyltransferase
MHDTMAAYSRSQWYRDTFQALGLVNLVALQSSSHFAKLGVHVRIGSPHLKHGVLIRPRTSDKLVFHQIFVEREYRCLDGVTKADFIVDCGANVGYSAAYFLSRYPRADVFAVEPDAENFRQLDANVAPYGSRCTTFHGAVWDRSTACLSLDKDSMARDAEWGRRVSEADSGDVTAIDIGTILASSGHKTISILKIDIEGAEETIFRGNTDWLSRVDNIVIELHGEVCEQAFFAALAPFNFDISQCDELTVCKRR